MRTEQLRTLALLENYKINPHRHVGDARNIKCKFVDEFSGISLNTRRCFGK